MYFNYNITYNYICNFNSNSNYILIVYSNCMLIVIVRVYYYILLNMIIIIISIVIIVIVLCWFHSSHLVPNMKLFTYNQMFIMSLRVIYHVKESICLRDTTIFLHIYLISLLNIIIRHIFMVQMGIEPVYCSIKCAYTKLNCNNIVILIIISLII